MDKLQEYLKSLDENLELIKYVEHDDEIHLDAKFTKKEVLCPCCRYTTIRVSSKYMRSFQDIPLNGKRVIIHMPIRKMLCFNPFCTVTAFMERFEFLARNSRKTKRLEELIVNTFMNCGAGKAEAVLQGKGISITRRTIYHVLHRWTECR